MADEEGNDDDDDDVVLRVEVLDAPIFLLENADDKKLEPDFEQNP